MILAIIALSLLFSAFFSGMEIAFVSVNKMRVQLRNKQGILKAKILSSFLESPSKFIGSLLVGNNIALVIYASYFAKLFEENRALVRFLNQLDIKYGLPQDILLLLIQTLVSTIIVLVFAEYLPKVFFRINPHRVLSFFAFPLNVFYKISNWFVEFIVFLSKGILKRIFRIQLAENKSIFTKLDLGHFMVENEITTTIEESNVDLNYFQKALNLMAVKVKECMIHRTEIIGIDVNENIENLLETFQTSELSKILVYDENIDNIIGFVHFSKLLSRPKDIKSIVMPIGIVPESMAATELLNKFSEERKSIALVVDEFGGTSGIVTIEDVIEEIFGEIEDEFDSGDLIEIQHSETEFTFSARQEIDYLNEKYAFDLPKGDYETLGGLIFEIHQAIPEKKERILIEGNYEVKILTVSKTKIEKVKLKILTL